MVHALRGGLQQRQQRIDEAALTLSHCLQRAVAEQRRRLPLLEQKLIYILKNTVSAKRQCLPGLQQTMTYCLQNSAAERKQNLHRLEVQLRALSPLAVLNRGYSLTQTKTGTVVRDVRQIKPGELLRTRLAKGTVLSEVKDKEA
jgi:exodeoxyribonuclease VII large subunit